jgi:guanine deaminase
MNGEEYMREAIELAINNVKNGGGPFGAVIVKDGLVVARGYNQVTTINDPTAHAEVMAIRAASSALGTFDLAGCEIYSSCEPCPMCLGAIYWAHIDKVFFSADKNNANRYGFDDQSIEEELKKDRTERSITMIQMLSKEGLQPFQAWEDFIDKKRY